MIQVLSEDRPSNRSIPFSTAIHVSWTTSSATARLGTCIIARRISIGPYAVTSSMKAASSPSRSP